MPSGAFFDREAFVSGYIEAALWADGMPATMDESGETGGLDHLHVPDSVRTTMRERGMLDDFIDANLSDLREYVARRGDGMASYAGHDFWLTRMGHGTGFWDRGLGELGERLTAAAEHYGSPDDHVPFDAGDGTAGV